MKKSFFLLSFFLLIGLLSVQGQRKMEKLDRGVVAVRNTTGNFFVSWRFLATDPENLQFNLYAKSSTASAFAKLNSSPLTVTNFTAASGTISTGTQLYVTTVQNGVESAASSIFTVSGTGFNTYRSAYLDISFNSANDGLALYQYSTKFCWPTDLDGDGEYDFVVDRLSTTGGSHKIQGYLRNGTLLWTVDMGPNVSICQGQDDMVTAYDMNGDGKGDVVIKSSDGTIFANGKGVNGVAAPYDTDNDGIVNYELQNVKNPPQYITVIDGMTGLEKNSIEMKYPSNYTRTNKNIFMGDEYSNLNGHMSILYLDGKHPSVGFIYKTRTSSDQFHWYYASAYGYDKSGNLVNWYNWERGKQNCAEGHGIRAADVDLDGHDELLDIGYGLKYDGSLAFSANISHGDRFRTGDLDPDRPGLETFAIQQNAPNQLGQLIYDAGTGTAIKKLFLSGVGDVGRGECMDVDSTRFGYEFWSTMPNIYDAKGNILFEGATPWPSEGVWWDGDLAREELAATDGSGFNADIRKYDMNSHAFGSRLIEFAKMTSWQVQSEWGIRPAFFGDIAGDWREEVVLEKKGTTNITLKDINGNDSIGSVGTCPGFVAFSTDYPTSKRIYCLMQNPAYRMQASTKGYYQSALPDFYLGYSMPTPPLAPVQQAKLTWVSGSSFDKTNSNFVLADEKTTSTFTDGDDVMFDISGNNASAISLTADMAPYKLWAMNPLGHNFTLEGSGKLTGTMELVKSMNGTFTLNGNHTYTGKTTISEGILQVNGLLVSPVTVQAKGTLAGNAVINGGITINQGLNIEGGRLSPGNGLAAGKLGKMTINSDLTLGGKTNLHFDILPMNSYKNDSLVINGNLTATSVNKIVINTESGVLPSGTYSLMKWTGALTGTLSNFVIAGISGLPMALVIEDNTLKLVVNATRSAGNVKWTGKESVNWDYLSANFKLSEGSTYFVNGDSVQFNDTATIKTINITDNMTVAQVAYNNSTSYVLKGTGGITGSANLIKTGKGLLDIQTVNNGYTGKTTFTDAVVQVASLADAGANSSLGAATTTASNISLSNTRLIINAVTSNTNRGITIAGTDTINVPKSNGVISFTGLVTGTGKLVKTGPGQLNLSGSVANTYTGGTVINGSTLALGSLTMNSTGLGSGAVTLENGGRIAMFYNTSDYNQKPNWAMTVAEGQSGTLIASGRCVIGGSLSGGGLFYLYVPYSRADWSANCANFTGTLNLTTDADGGNFRVTANTNGLPLCTVNLANMVDMGAYATIGASGTSTSTVVKVGALSGVAGSWLSGGTWQIGNNNKDALFAGTIGSGASVTKIGTGNWILSGANATTNPFYINGGKLTVVNTTGSATGTSTVYVNNTGTLAGTGIIQGTTSVSSGGSIAPGNNAVGKLTFNSGLSLLAGSNTLIEVNKPSNINDQIVATGTIGFGGTLTIINTSSTPFAAGDSIKVFSATNYLGSFTDVVPATPGNGLAWDLSELNTKGKIKVALPQSIKNIADMGITIAPNPATDKIKVTFPESFANTEVAIYSVNGTLMFRQKPESTQMTIRTADYNPGVYILKITTSGRVAVGQIVKK